MNEDDDGGKWRPVPLKNRWYDDHFGLVATRKDIVDNRLRLLDERFAGGDEEDMGSAQVERFFDLFDHS